MKYIENTPKKSYVQENKKENTQDFATKYNDFWSKNIYEKN